MKSGVAAAAIAFCCALPAEAAHIEELTPFFSTQHFTWREHAGGRRLLKEEGALFSVGAVIGHVTPSSIVLRGKGEIFAGEVGYRGETQAPSPIPVGTDVRYFGTRAEIDLGYRLHSSSYHLDPFARVGRRWWLRDLRDTTAADGSAVSGYTEKWQTLYAGVGGRGEFLLSSGAKVSAEAGARYPFYVGNSIDFVNAGVTTVHPKGGWSGFAETGITYRSLKLAVSYEGFRFAESPLKPVTERVSIFQPDSSADIFGMSIGWTFR